MAGRRDGPTAPGCGCRICVGEQPGADWNEHDRQLLRDVEEHGWHVVAVKAEGGAPGWAFSVGLLHSFGTPELAMFGLAQDVLHRSLNTIGEMARAGEVLAPDLRSAEVLETYDVVLRAVHRGWHRALFGYALWFFPPEHLAVLQCVWPDKAGRMPWDEQFDGALHRYQPALWAPPEEERPGPWRAWWRASEWPGRTKSNGLVFVSKRVAEAGAPVLGVTAFTDGDWAFLDGGPVDAKSIVLHHLQHILELDPTLEATMGLRPGTQAWRQGPGGEWAVSTHDD